jgi:ferredoxin
MSVRRVEQRPRRLEVDPVACDGVGLCAHLAPAVVQLDRWGYPVVPLTALSRSQQRRADRAVRGCPRRALAVVESTEETR